MTDTLSNPDEMTPKKSSRRIFKQEVEEGVDALDRSTYRLFISALAAGMEIGLSLLLLSITRTFKDELSTPAFEFLMATMYSFGFVVVVLGRSELFTEQTTLAILPLLDGKTTLAKVARLWGIVYVANLIGAAICAAFVVWTTISMEVSNAGAFGAIATKIVEHPWWVMVISGVMAGWLMGLVSWLVAAARDTTSQIIIIWIITATIGLGHFHHAVLGSVEVLGGIFAGEGITWNDFGKFQLSTTLGNAIGGAFFVAVLKHGHSAPGKRRSKSS